MAWNSKRAEAMVVAGLHLGVMPWARKIEFSERCARNIFQDPHNSKDVVQWERHWGITIAFLGPRENLIRNLEFAMIQELLDMGPPKYCLVCNNLRGFGERVLLVLNYLPKEKICLYPPTTIPRGPFEKPAWRSLGKELSERRVSLNDFDAPETWRVNTDQDMMCVRFSSDDYLINNVRFALMKEKLGEEPQMVLSRLREQATK